MKHLAFLLLTLGCPAYAAPVYLKCQLDADSKKADKGEDLAAEAPMDVTLNEDAGTVTYTFPTAGRAYTVRGVFTVDKVAFNGFSIDRTNLAFEREDGFGTAGAPRAVDHGRCVLAVVKRAF